MEDDKAKPIPELLLKNIPRELILAVEEGLEAGAVRAYTAAKNSHEGHIRNVLGQARHFWMNEAYSQSLESVGASPSPIKGNSIVIGSAGIVRLGRFNTLSGPWNSIKRTASRRIMAQANLAIEPLAQPNLFDMNLPVVSVTAFFVAVFSGSLQHSPERPISIDIAVPDSSMRDWLFREPIFQFLARYNQSNAQRDGAVPQLKTSIITMSEKVEK
jgi:hypothetical protein